MDILHDHSKFSDNRVTPRYELLQRQEQKVLFSQVLVVHALIPAFRRQKQADLCKFKVNLVYRVSGHLVLYRKILSQKNKNSSYLFAS